DVARPELEAQHLVVTDEGLSAGIADDDEAGLGDDRAAAFLHLAPFAAERIDPLRTGWLGARRDRPQRLCRLWRRRQRGGHGRRRPLRGDRRDTGRRAGRLRRNGTLAGASRRRRSAWRRNIVGAAAACRRGWRRRRRSW